MMSPIPPQPPRLMPLNPSDPMVVFQLQLISIAWATQNLFLGQLVLATLRAGDSLGSTLQAIQFSFLEMPIPRHDGSVQFIWGNVLKGIEEMSHNVTAGLLTLQLGNISSECFFPIVAYEYSPFALWVPYGVSNCSLLLWYGLNFTFSSWCFIDSLGHFSDFTCYFRHDNGEKQHWRCHDIIFKYSYFDKERGWRYFSGSKVEVERGRVW